MAKKENNSAYRAPKTGEKRKTRQPFSIDKFPQEVRDAILKARAQGKTWEETAHQASVAAGATIPVMNVHRWYDVRVEQVAKETREEIGRAHEIATVFGGKDFEGLEESVKSALATEVFKLVAASDPASRNGVAKQLESLGWLLSEMRRSEIQRGKLELDKEKVQIAQEKLQLVREKIRGVKALVGKKQVSNAELKTKLDEIYGITEQHAA